MHPYATDSAERTEVLFWLALASIVVSYAAYLALDFFGLGQGWQLIAQPPSAVGLYLLLHKIFDKHLWKLPIMRKLKVVRLPDLSGEWNGYVESSYPKPWTKYDVSMRIVQTWNKISINLRSERSHSESLLAGIYMQKGTNPTILYEFHSKPFVKAEETMQEHDGSAKLSLESKTIDGRTITKLSGEYFTGRGRMRNGSIHLERIIEKED